MPIHYTLYASRLTCPMGHDALCRLLDTSQANNARAALSGFLHIEGDIVLQYLEGPEPSVRRMIGLISEDPRHEDFSIVSSGRIERRYFDNWKMALVETTTLSLVDVMGSQCRHIRELVEAHPLDLITFLSVNASYLHDAPRRG